MNTAGAWSFMKETGAEFLDESPFQLAAALSFYRLLSLSPLLLVVVSTTGFVWGEEAVRTQLVTEIEQMAGPAGTETVELVLRHVKDPRSNRISVVVGVATLLLGATFLGAEITQVYARRRGAWITFVAHAALAEPASGQAA